MDTADRSGTLVRTEAEAALKSSLHQRERLLRPWYRNFVLLMVLLGFMLSFTDRQIFSVLMPALKAEFSLSDATLGLMSGLAFALFYATAGVPIARLGDRTSRRGVMTISMLVWSVMTGLCSVAHGAAQLFGSRFGVGVGEAGFSPCAMALVADYFPEKNRGLALGLVNTGPLIGMMLGLAIGGWAVDLVGWRGAFLIVGAPGVVFAAVFWLTVKEPWRGMADGVLTRPGTAPKTMWRGASVLWRTRAFRYVVLAASVSALGLYGSSTWMPSYLMRAYHMDPRTVGLILGPIVGIGGGVGVLLGGVLNDALRRRDLRWPMWLPALSSLLVTPVMIGALLTNNPKATLVLYAVAYSLAVVWVAPTFSVVQALVSVSMRATATAWKLLFTQLIGMGLGPAIVGVLSDRFAGRESLGSAMIVSSFSLILAAGLYVYAALFVRDDLERVER
jgi:predicted MFS family arabinose efflux permease